MSKPKFEYTHVHNLVMLPGFRTISLPNADLPEKVGFFSPFQIYFLKLIFLSLFRFRHPSLFSHFYRHAEMKIQQSIAGVLSAEAASHKEEVVAWVEPRVESAYV